MLTSTADFQQLKVPNFQSLGVPSLTQRRLRVLKGRHTSRTRWLTPFAVQL